MNKLLTIIALHIALVNHSSTSTTSYIAATYRVFWSSNPIATIFTILECWIIGTLVLSSTKIMKVISTFVHERLSFFLFVSLNEMGLQINLCISLINIPFIISMLICLKRTLQLLFAYHRKFLWFLNRNIYIAKS